VSFEPGKVSATVNLEACDDDQHVATFTASVVKSTMDPKTGRLVIVLECHSNDDEYVAWPLTKMQGWKFAVRWFTQSRSVHTDVQQMRRLSGPEKEAAAARRRELAAARKNGS